MHSPKFLLLTVLIVGFTVAPRGYAEENCPEDTVNTKPKATGKKDKEIAELVSKLDSVINQYKTFIASPLAATPFLPKSDIVQLRHFAQSIVQNRIPKISHLLKLIKMIPLNELKEEEQDRAVWIVQEQIRDCLNIHQAIQFYVSGRQSLYEKSIHEANFKADLIQQIAHPSTDTKTVIAILDHVIELIEPEIMQAYSLLQLFFYPLPPRLKHFSQLQTYATSLYSSLATYKYDFIILKKMYKQSSPKDLVRSKKPAVGRGLTRSVSRLINNYLKESDALLALQEFIAVKMYLPELTLSQLEYNKDALDDVAAFLESHKEQNTSESINN